MVAMCSNDHASPGFLLSHQNLRAICLGAETSMRCFARCAEKFAGLDPTQYRYGCAYIIDHHCIRWQIPSSSLLLVYHFSCLLHLSICIFAFLARFYDLGIGRNRCAENLAEYIGGVHGLYSINSIICDE